MQPKITNVWKLSASLSYRVAIRRCSLSRPINRSTTLRLLYLFLSKRSAPQGYDPSRHLRWGISGSEPRCEITSREEAPSYPLSPDTTAKRLRGAPGLPPIDTPSKRGSSMVDSWTWPGVNLVMIGNPCPSQSRWIFVEKPPRERPKPCFCWLCSTEALFFERRRHTCVPVRPSRPRRKTRSRSGRPFARGP